MRDGLEWRVCVRAAERTPLAVFVVRERFFGVLTRMTVCAAEKTPVVVAFQYARRGVITGEKMDGFGMMRRTVCEAEQTPVPVVFQHEARSHRRRKKKMTFWNDAGVWQYSNSSVPTSYTY